MHAIPARDRQQKRLGKYTLGKLITVGVIGIGTALDLLPYTFLLGIPSMVAAFVIFEIFAFRLSRVAPAPWVPALFQAAWIGWTFGAIFPYEG